MDFFLNIYVPMSDKLISGFFLIVLVGNYFDIVAFYLHLEKWDILFALHCPEKIENCAYSYIITKKRLEETLRTFQSYFDIWYPKQILLLLRVIVVFFGSVHVNTNQYMLVLIARFFKTCDIREKKISWSVDFYLVTQINIEFWENKNIRMNTHNMYMTSYFCLVCTYMLTYLFINNFIRQWNLLIHCLWLN